MGARSAKTDAEWRIRVGLLGLSAPDDQPADLWPSQAEAAKALSLTRARVGQVFASDRKRWAKDPLLNALRAELYEQIQRLGGVATVGELIE